MTCGEAGGTNAAGEPCRSELGLSEVNGLCPTHDPLRAEAMREARANGGRASGLNKRNRRAEKRQAGMPEGVTLIDASLKFVPLKTPKAPKNLEDARRLSSWLFYMTVKGKIDSTTAREAKAALDVFARIAEKRAMEKELEELRAELARHRKPRLA
jgi:hypothetical protein